MVEGKAGLPQDTSRALFLEARETSQCSYQKSKSAQVFEICVGALGAAEIEWSLPKG